VLDPSVEPDFKAIRALHPGDPQPVGRDEADNTWLIAFTDDAGPVQYYAYDRSSRTGSFLFSSRPELSRFDLARMEPFSFKARDGLTVHGYVTFPPEGGRTGLPTVLNVHGGPQARDVWGWDPEAQWLANRGYLCIQVNYRGSTGYGKSFVAAGDREWGAKMHDDLLDAVQYAVDQGWADPAKVAIYGGSYGGYAALVGAAFTPDVFCCAVDIVGPSNLQTLLESIPPYWKPMAAALYKRVGNPETDKEFLWSRSPLSRARDIRIPLLIAQGANRPAGQAGRVGADRGGAQGSRDRVRVHAVPRRGPWLRQAGKPAEVPRRGRALPGQVPGRPVRGVTAPRGRGPGLARAPGRTGTAP